MAGLLPPAHGDLEAYVDAAFIVSVAMQLSDGLQIPGDFITYSDFNFE